MSVQALVMMIAVLCLTWGLFAVLLICAVKLERKKQRSEDPEG